MTMLPYLWLAVSLTTLGVVTYLVRDIRRLRSRLDRFAQASADQTTGVLRQITQQTRRQHLLTRATVDAVAGISAVAHGVPPLPSSQGWAASPMVQRRLAEVVAQRLPNLVVELGGGSSTVLVAHLLRAQGAKTQRPGRLVSIDHDAAYAEVTREHLRRHGLESFVEIRIAELTDLTIGGQTWQWYDITAFEDLHDIDVLFVDGPPGIGRKLARYPAVPILQQRLAANADVILDDADRRDERAMSQRWQTENGAVLVASSNVGTGWAHLRLPG